MSYNLSMGLNETKSIGVEETGTLGLIFPSLKFFLTFIPPLFSLFSHLFQLSLSFTLFVLVYLLFNFPPERQ